MAKLVISYRDIANTPEKKKGTFNYKICCPHQRGEKIIAKNFLITSDERKFYERCIMRVIQRT